MDSDNLLVAWAVTPQEAGVFATSHFFKRAEESIA